MCEEAWPLCKCGNPVDPRRVAALDGVVRCKECPCPPLNVMRVEVSKSNEIFTTDPCALVGSIGRHFAVGRSEQGKAGNYMKLGKKE